MPRSAEKSCCTAGADGPHHEGCLRRSPHSAPESLVNGHQSASLPWGSGEMLVGTRGSFCSNCSFYVQWTHSPGSPGVDIDLMELNSQVCLCVD